MALSDELVSLFAKTMTPEKKTNEETTMIGTIVIEDRVYVRLDGSDRLTPISTTADTKDGERVMVQIKDHTATVTGNMSSPAARTHDVQEIGGKITSFEHVIADSITTRDLEAINATIDSLRAVTANIDSLTVDELNAINAEIDNLEATYGNIEHVTAETVEAFKAEIEVLESMYIDVEEISVEDLDAVNAEIDNLVAHYAKFEYVLTDNIKAINAEVRNLNVNYATIDFANIGQAAVEKLFSDSGIIKDLIVSEGKITGELVGVTIKGDWIEAGTLKADRLLVKGENGLYYKMNVENGVTTSEEISLEDLQNGIHGSVIVAKSITANKIAVEDLVAFGATIGRFTIADNEETGVGTIYSGVKESFDNITQGLYMDSEGQMVLGDQYRFIKYGKDQDGLYQLQIQADKLLLGIDGQTVEERVKSELKIGARNLIRNSETLEFEDYGFVGDSNTNTRTSIVDVGPDGTSASIAKFSINDTGWPIFRFADVLTAGKQYTISFWAKCDSAVYGAGYIAAFEETEDSEGMLPISYGQDYWFRNEITATATSSNLDIYFSGGNGDYYIYHMKVEEGNMVTDWTPSPDDAKEFEQKTSATLEINSKDITATFESINDLENRTHDQETFEKYQKYIRFSEDGIEIGDSNSEDANAPTLKLKIDNSGIYFLKSTETNPVAYWDGNELFTGNIHVQTTEQARFGNFSFIPRTDGSLSFLKVGE